jgi:hypothetical protein
VVSRAPRRYKAEQFAPLDTQSAGVHDRTCS